MLVIWWLQCVINGNKVHLTMYHHIAGNSGKGGVWRIDSFQAFGEKKFGKLIDQLIDLLIVSTNLDGFSLTNYRQFAKFAKLSHYMVCNYNPEEVGHTLSIFS